MSTKTIREVKVLTVREEASEGCVVSSVEDLVSFWRSNVETASWFDSMKECVVCVCLNMRGRITAWNLVSLGTASASLVHPREVFRPVIVAGSSSFALMHNHPSGDPTPSAADIRITRTIREAASILDIDFTDHVIVGDSKADPTAAGHYSFRAAGLI